MIDFLSSIVSFFSGIASFFSNVISTGLYAIRFVAVAVVQIPKYLGFFPSAIVSIIMLLISLAIAFRIIGIFGGD